MWCMDTIKKTIKLQVSIKKLIGVYIGVLLICVLALVLPAMTDKQEKDYWIEISSEKLESQGEYPYVAVEGNPYFVLDNFSESIVLNCIYNANAEQVWKDTLAQKRFAVSEEEITNLRILATGGTGEFGSDGWQRMLPYWMGCRSFLSSAFKCDKLYDHSRNYTNGCIFVGGSSISTFCRQDKLETGIVLGAGSCYDESSDSVVNYGAGSYVYDYLYKRNYSKSK